MGRDTGQFYSYAGCVESENLRAKTMQKIAEYEHFYLFGKYNDKR